MRALGQQAAKPAKEARLCKLDTSQQPLFGPSKTELEACSPTQCTQSTQYTRQSSGGVGGPGAAHGRGWRFAGAMRTGGAAAVVAAVSAALLQAQAQAQNISSVSVGDEFTCAVHGGRVYCFGRALQGQLGFKDGSTRNRGDDAFEMGDNLGAGVDLEADIEVVKIVSGARHTCALSTLGYLYCWGVGSDGQTGHEDGATYGDGPNELGLFLPFTLLPAGRTAVDMCAGSYFTCALLDDATTRCFGSNSQGQLAQGVPSSEVIGNEPREMGNNLPAMDWSSTHTVRHIACGVEHVCVVLAGASPESVVKCVGRNDNGQLGIAERDTQSRGTTSSELGDALPMAMLFDAAPMNASRTRTVAKLALGETFSCALLSDGSVSCLGSGLDMPVVDVGASTVPAVDIAAGHSHAIILFEDGTVCSVGTGAFGQLGAVTCPHRIPLGTNTTARAVVAGRYHTAVVLSDGNMKLFGRNNAGQLGLGDTLDRGSTVSQMGDALTPTFVRGEYLLFPIWIATAAIAGAPFVLSVLYLVLEATLGCCSSSTTSASCVPARLVHFVKYTFTLALSLLDIITDILFVLSVDANSGTFHNAVVISSIVFLTLPVVAFPLVARAQLLSEVLDSSGCPVFPGFLLVWAFLLPYSVLAFAFKLSGVPSVDSAVRRAMCLPDREEEWSALELNMSILTEVFFESIPQLLINAIFVASVLGSDEAYDPVYLITLATSSAVITWNLTPIMIRWMRMGSLMDALSYDRFNDNR